MTKEEIGAAIGPDPSVFKDLLEIAFSREMPVCWRAMWIMDHMDEAHPGLAKDHVHTLWAEVDKEHPVGVLRSNMRLLVRYDIPEDYQGIAADLCLSWLEKESVSVAIKAYSMNILYKIAQIYPEISSEFITILEEQAPKNSAGFKAKTTFPSRRVGFETKEPS